ncbi:MAG TPA: CopD family protein, partial [Longimicrobiaceae bacterium]
AGWRVAAAACGVLALATASGGHAAAVEGLRPLALAGGALHVLGAGAWLGALALLLAAGLPAALAAPAGERGAAAAELVRRFSPLALAAAGTAAITGVAAALFHLGAPAELWETAYGRALLVKLALLAAVAAAGLYNWRALTPQLGADGSDRRLRRTAAVELGMGVLVVVVTAVLVALPTP